MSDFVCGLYLFHEDNCDLSERMLVAEYYQRAFGTDLPESVVGTR